MTFCAKACESAVLGLLHCAPDTTKDFLIHAYEHLSPSFSQNEIGYNLISLHNEHQDCTAPG